MSKYNFDGAKMTVGNIGDGANMVMAQGLTGGIVGCIGSNGQTTIIYGAPAPSEKRRRVVIDVGTDDDDDEKDDSDKGGDKDEKDHDKAIGSMTKDELRAFILQTIEDAKGA